MNLLEQIKDFYQDDFEAYLIRIPLNEKTFFLFPDVVYRGLLHFLRRFYLWHYQEQAVIFEAWDDIHETPGVGEQPVYCGLLLRREDQKEKFIREYFQELERKISKGARLIVYQGSYDQLNQMFSSRDFQITALGLPGSPHYFQKTFQKRRFYIYKRLQGNVWQ